MHRFLRTFALAAGSCSIALLIASSRCLAQADALDTSFNPGTGVSGFELFSVALQSDGKIIIGGDFTGVNGIARTSLARLNADGSVDASFNPNIINLGAEGQVNSVTLQPDGKMLIGGVYTSVNGTMRNGPVRLNADGSLDASYDTTSNVYYVNGVDYVVVLEADGKVLVGDFGGGIERTNADGSADSSFAPSSGDGSYNTGSYDNDISQVFAIAVQPDGRIVFGGHFITFAGVARPALARVNADGTLDTSFNPVTNLSQYGEISAVAVQPDGKIIFAGSDYDVAAGVTSGAIGRLNGDGSVDTSFQPNISADESVSTVAVQASGQLIVGGHFNTIDGAVHKGLARLNADGSLDATFNANIDSAGTPNDFVAAIVLQPNGKVLLGGSFSTVNGTARSEIAGLLGDHLPFFNGEVDLNSNVYYLGFPSGNYFGYYSYLPDPAYIYHFDLGYEYVFDAADGNSGVYLYDFASDTFFYTSPVFPFPYLYDFTLNTTLYYYPDPNNPGHYNTDGIRYFYDFNTGTIITK